ncbi:hypothetical protein OIV83_002235 [Microbotryomycetes sp. JL201]|nr:hypothetical protein OIV83_002235 [Microbotryomycetes sp. JL201]
MDQQAARDRFAHQSILILKGLPRGSEFGYDGNLWLVDKFSASPNRSPPTRSTSSSHSPEDVSSGIGTRRALLRWFTKQRQVIVDEWDNTGEHLRSELDSRTRKRRRTVASLATGGTSDQQMIVSDEYLQALDRELAPYSDDVQQRWLQLVNFVTQETIARVIGFDDAGNAFVEATMPSLADEHELKQARQKQTWGKPRSDEQRVVVVDSDEETPQDELLRFAKIDAKRSWPSGAVGSELTRWSKDKSWQLSTLVSSELGGDATQLLAELQLSFVLFALVHNFSSLATFKSIITLVCRSSTLTEPPSQRLSTTDGLLTDAAMPLIASFLSVLETQLAFLDQSFFSDHMPGLDIFLLQELDQLNANLTDSAPTWSQLDQALPAVKVWQQLIRNWNSLSMTATEKFGWEIKAVRGARTQGYAGYNLLRRDNEVDIEDLEEGEDAPVIVET